MNRTADGQGRTNVAGAGMRKSDLAKIHIAKKDLGMDDDTYRAMLQLHFGVGSAKDLKPNQVVVLLNKFRAKGWKPKRPKRAGRKPNTMRTPLGKQALMSKIEAHLAERGLPWAYADGMARKICKVERVEFCDSDMLIKLVAAFEYDSRRKQSHRKPGGNGTTTV